jgi:hypothetical protein
VSTPTAISASTVVASSARDNVDRRVVTSFVLRISAELAPEAAFTALRIALLFAKNAW